MYCKLFILKDILDIGYTELRFVQVFVSVEAMIDIYYSDFINHHQLDYS